MNRRTNQMHATTYSRDVIHDVRHLTLERRMHS
jgi:hypothetical protein